MSEPMELEDQEISFQELGLDARLERSVAKLGWKQPTLVQQAAIPLALSGKDLLVHAKTGTGKTACYALPVIQSVLVQKKSSDFRPHVTALVLVPTKELSRQVKGNFEELCKYCDNVSVVELAAAAESAKEQKALLRDLPDIVIATPARIAARLADGSLAAATCSVLVVDEADLVLGYGYAGDVSSILQALPASRQTFLMSATLSADVKKLQKEALNRPSLLKLEEGDDGDNDEKDKKLRQLSLRAPLADRFLICYVLLKLRLIQGKTVVFVNSVDQGFRLHLFLAAFFIPSLVLNSELPENSRNFILGEFDAGKCPILIATDESHLLPREEEDVGQANEDEDANDDEDDEAEKPNEKKKKRPKKAASKRALDVAEFGVARGFDFKAVANVINFDFPPTAEAYVHRIGRTARAGARGNAISFVCGANEEDVLSAASALQSEPVAPFAFRLAAVEGFRYRVEDVLQQITRDQIKEARSNELKTEILRSAALKKHFEEHPRDLEVLNSTTRAKRAKMIELKHVPDYLRPTAHDNAQIKQAMNTAVVNTKKKKRNYSNSKKKKNDPLRSMKVQK